MKANTVYVHGHLPHAVLQGGTDAFYRISTSRRGDLALADEVTGDLLPNRVKWCFNITRSTLIRVVVLSCHPNRGAAILATVGAAVHRS